MVIKNHNTGKRADLFDSSGQGYHAAKIADTLALFSVVNFISASGSAMVAPEQNQYLQSDAAVRLTAKNRTGCYK